jgi:hypothetical protein
MRHWQPEMILKIQRRQFIVPRHRSKAHQPLSGVFPCQLTKRLGVLHATAAPARSKKNQHRHTRVISRIHLPAVHVKQLKRKYLIRIGFCGGSSRAGVANIAAFRRAIGLRIGGLPALQFGFAALGIGHDAPQHHNQNGKTNVFHGHPPF